MKKNYFNAVDFSHQLLENNIKRGDIVIDATAGNGHDTKYMAELVKKEGRVYAFDIQKDAIINTQKLLKEKNLNLRCKLINDSHSNLDNHIEEKVKAVIFNLGYLPGGNKNIITKAKSTIKALKISLKKLKKDGIVILVIYSGHPGGKEEKNKIIKYCSNLNHKIYNVFNYNFLNQPTPPPEIVAIKKRF